MALKFTREGGGKLSVEHSDPLVEVGLAMAALNTNWGFHGDSETLAKSLGAIIDGAAQDPRTGNGELVHLQGQSQKIQLMEQLAQSFRSTRDESDDELPRYQGELWEARQMVEDYARSLGCKMEIQ